MTGSGPGLIFPYDESNPGAQPDAVDYAGQPRKIVASSVARLARAANDFRQGARSASQASLQKGGGRRVPTGVFPDSRRSSLLSLLDKLEAEARAVRSDYGAYIAGMQEILADYSAWMQEFGAGAGGGPGESVLGDVLRAMEALATAASGGD